MTQILVVDDMSGKRRFILGRAIFWVFQMPKFSKKNTRNRMQIYLQISFSYFFISFVPSPFPRVTSFSFFWKHFVLTRIYYRTKISQKNYNFKISAVIMNLIISISPCCEKQMETAQKAFMVNTNLSGRKII